jgi:hypothetical protein
MRFWRTRLGLALCAAAAFSGPAVSQPSTESNVKVGLLKCLVEGGTGFIFGSTKNLDCKYEGIGGQKETYKGEISKYGLDLGVTQKGLMYWTVLAPSPQLRERALAGGYGGVTAGASVGYGANANALIGGFGNAITLQPLSVQIEEGVNLAVGIAAMQLY